MWSGWENWVKWWSLWKQHTTLHFQKVENVTRITYSESATAFSASSMANVTNAQDTEVTSRNLDKWNYKYCDNNSLAQEKNSWYSEDINNQGKINFLYCNILSIGFFTSLVSYLISSNDVIVKHCCLVAHQCKILTVTVRCVIVFQFFLKGLINIK